MKGGCFAKVSPPLRSSTLAEPSIRMVPSPTAGRGTPLGAPIVPVIKVSSNSSVYEHMKENIDINAGEILEGRETIKSVGDKIFREIIEVASGKVTAAEALGHAEFAIHSLGD